MKFELNKMSKITYRLNVVISIVAVITLLDVVNGKPQYVDQPVEVDEPQEQSNNERNSIHIPIECSTDVPMTPSDCIEEATDTKLCKQVDNYPRECIKSLLDNSKVKYQPTEVSHVIRRRSPFENEKRL